MALSMAGFLLGGRIVDLSQTGSWIDPSGDAARTSPKTPSQGARKHMPPSFVLCAFGQ